MLTLVLLASRCIASCSVTGCPFRPGDLLGTGTISGPTDDSLGTVEKRTFVWV